MKEDYIVIGPPKRALGDAPQERACLRCRASFLSEGFGQRICARCKSSAAWRTAMPEAVGQGRRRSGGRSS